METLEEGVFIVNFEHISSSGSSVSIVNFGKVTADWFISVHLLGQQKQRCA